MIVAVIKIILVLCLLLQVQTNLLSLKINDLVLELCDTKNYPVIVSNVTVSVPTKHNVKVTGSLSTKIDLLSPIKASVWLKRDVWGIWIPIPCEDGVGSCDYDDLCSFGLPTNETCPPNFIDNNVPCRCPISKGNYTILPSLDLTDGATSIIAGTYKATVMITQGQALLSCYNAKFKLTDSFNNANEPVVILV